MKGPSQCGIPKGLYTPDVGLLLSRVSVFLSPILVAAGVKSFNPSILHLNIWHFCSHLLVNASSV